MALIPERSINDMTSPDLNQQPLCIEYPDLEVDFELKSGLIHLLPTFRGLAGEDPHKHLKEFHVDPSQDGTISKSSSLRNTSLPQEPQQSERRSVEFDNTREKAFSNIGKDSID
ncbi:UNVERIFIED_CONTAM: hypothetical protein Sindi_2643800 [Sesamum indicum]